MILSDKSIKELVKDGKLIAENYNEEMVTSEGYDLRIGSIVDADRTFMRVETLETLDLPKNVGASIYIINSLSESGLFGSFGFVDAGFHGKLTLTFHHLGHWNFFRPIPNAPLMGRFGNRTLKYENRIVKIVFFYLDKETGAPYDGKYQQKPAGKPKVKKTTK